jgi:hypothetical protein
MPSIELANSCSMREAKENKNTKNFKMKCGNTKENNVRIDS